MEIKKGFKSSEFWVVIGGVIVSGLTAIANIPELDQFPEIKALFIAGTQFATVGYAFLRSWVKAASAKSFQG